MKKFSKLFWVALVVVAVLACTAIGVFAAETTSTAVVYAESVEVANNFSVDFSFKNNNTKVECGKITLTWDSNKMTAESIVAADALNGAQFGSKIENGKAVIAWAGSSISDGTATGTLFTVNFANKGIANDGFAVIEAEVDNFGYTEGFVAKELKSTVTACSAYAMGTELNDFNYTSDTAESPAQFLEAALAQAATTKEDVTVLISSEMEFTEDVRIGEGSYVEDAGTVYVSAALDAEGMPTTGIKVYADVVVNIYGKVNFNNVLIGNTQYVYGATLPTTVEEFNNGSSLKNSYSSGGCIEFAAGLGTFGLAENQAEEGETPDFGYIGINPDANAFKVVTTEGENTTETLQQYTDYYMPHVAGYVKVYTGTYWSVSGNYHKSGVTIDNPTVYVGGNSRVYYLFGGAHNGNKENTPITGDITLTIGGYANVTDASVGSWYSATNQIGGSGIVTDNAKVSIMTAGFAGSGTIEKDAKYTFTITSDNVEIGTLAAHRFNSEGQASTNVQMTLSQGKIGYIYGGFISEWNYNSSKETAHNELYGFVDIDITNTILHPDNEAGANPYQVEVWGGSLMRHKGDIHNAELTLDVSNVTGTAGKQSMNFYLGSKMVVNTNSNSGRLADSTGSDHSGKSVATFTDVSLTTSGSSWALLSGGSSIDTVSTHSGDVEITLTNFDCEKRVIGGSYLNKSGAEHAGDTTIHFDGVSSGLTSIVNGGSVCYRADTIHSGNTKVILEGVDNTADNGFACTVYGGSALNNSGTKHTGTSEVEILGGRPKSVIYGGSELKNPRTSQTNTSKVTINGTTITLVNTVYGGSNAAAFTTTDANAITESDVKGAYGHNASSSVEFIKGYSDNIHIYGGSNLNYSTEWIKQGYVVQGVKDGDCTTAVNVAIENAGRSNAMYRSQVFGSARLTQGGFQYGDSKVDISDTNSSYSGGFICVQRIAAAYLGEGAELVGDCSVNINNDKAYVRFNGSTANNIYSIIGGAYGSGKLTGNSSLTFKGTGAKADFYSTTLKANAASVEFVGGCFFTSADSVMTGNSTLEFDGVQITAKVQTTNAGDTYLPRRVIGGCYGPGTMVGNSTLKLLSDTTLSYISNSNNTVTVLAGCYGTNDITTEKDPTTGIFGGIRQTGDVEFIVDGNVMVDSFCNVAGEKSNVDGNVTIRISGTPTFGQVFSALGYREYYSSITGDLKAYVSGGTFNNHFLAGGRITNTANATYGVAPNGANGFDFTAGNTYVEISGGTFKGQIASAGEGGAVGDTYLKFVGDAFDIQSASGLYSASWGVGNKVVAKEGQRDILDLSLVTDLALDYTNFTRVATEGDTLPTMGNSSERGFDIVYPSLYDASAITVTLDDKNIYPGAVLEDADTLAITYANGVTAHTGTSAGNVTTSSFSGTVAELCEYDALASSEAAKTINAFKYIDADTQAEIAEVPASAAGFTTKNLIVKAGNASSASVAVRHGLRMSGATITLESDLSIKVRFDKPVENYYKNIQLVAIDEEGTETVLEEFSWNGSKNEFAFSGISPQRIGDLFDFKLRATSIAGEEVGETAPTSYGAITYCNSKLSDEKTELTTLIVDLLNYGAAAQIYWDYKADSLCNANLTETQKAFATPVDQIPAYEDYLSTKYEEIDNPTVSWKGATLSPNDRIDLRFTIEIPAESDVNTLKMKVKVGDKEAVYVDCTDKEPVANKENRYYQRFTQLLPQELREPVCVTICDAEGNALSNTARYSVSSYAYSNTGDGKEQTLVDFLNTMMAYGDATKAYFG